jgi:hypothetical protein
MEGMEGMEGIFHATRVKLSDFLKNDISAISINRA